MSVSMHANCTTIERDGINSVTQAIDTKNRSLLRHAFQNYQELRGSAV